MTIRILETADWEPLLAFELRNRSWFEQYVDPRGDAFYCKAGVQRHIAEYLEAYAEGLWFPGLILDSDKTIIGRTNLKKVDIHTGTAELGYRIAYDRIGKGVATEAVIQMKALAQCPCGLKQLYAVVKPANLASVQVLQKCGFVQMDTAPPGVRSQSGERANIYQCTLAPA